MARKEATTDLWVASLLNESRVEYDAQGWVKSETLQTVDYDYRNETDSQVALKSIYTYKFSD